MYNKIISKKESLLAIKYMNYINYFFRTVEDGVPLKPYGMTHIIILSIFFVSILAISNKKFGLNNKNINNKFLLSLASIILIDQIILYTWLISSGNFKLNISLPLYHCRISVVFLLIGIFTNKKFFKLMTVFWGGLGSAMAMTIPDLYKYKFPHYTNFQFFIVHIILGLVVIDLLFVDKIKINIKDLRKILIFTNIYNIILIGINLYIGKIYPDTNYGYLVAVPGGYTLLNNKILHGLIMTLLFNIATIGLYKLFTKKYEEKNIWEISKSLVKIQSIE